LQLLTVLRGVSQPLTTLPSQLPKPLLHAIWQVEPTHDGVPFVPLHTLPQAPQLVGLVVVFVSHPFPALPSQSPRPGPHEEQPHAPLTQLGVQPAAGQTVPQALQLATSLRRFVSHPLFLLPSQLPQPTAQTGAQTPREHEVVPCAFVHVVPQAPQLATELWVFVSQPFCALPSQLPQPIAQVGAQTPPWQAVVPLGFEHATPHAPQ
jgi:hypothetical protein